MGIDDRDYMRDRYRFRQGPGGGKVSWNDSKSRCELPRGQHGMARAKPHPGVRIHPAQKWIFLLCALPTAFYAYRDMKRYGWIPDRADSLPFPSSGSVTVNDSVDPKTATSRIKVRAAEANVVVQLFNRKTDAHVISVYVNRNEDVSVPVPPGTYRMKLIEGDKWHGTTTWFGPSTTYETVIRPMVFTRRTSRMIDLHRSPDGNLHTSVNFTNPNPLN